MPSILKTGIRPVANLRGAGVQFHFNDNDRHDGNLGASCFSVGHPNYRMFYKCRQDNPDSKWVVLAVYSNVLDSMPCSYFYTNAANSVFRDINPADMRGPEYFNSMFDNTPTRNRPADLDNKYTTDPQAEIMIFGEIPPSQIYAILCMPGDVGTVQEVAKSARIHVNKWVFGPRRDHQSWV